MHELEGNLVLEYAQGDGDLVSTMRPVVNSIPNYQRLFLDSHDGQVRGEDVNSRCEQKTDTAEDTLGQVGTSYGLR